MRSMRAVEWLIVFFFLYGYCYYYKLLLGSADCQASGIRIFLLIRAFYTIGAYNCEGRCIWLHFNMRLSSLVLMGRLDSIWWSHRHSTQCLAWKTNPLVDRQIRLFHTTLDWAWTHRLPLILNNYLGKKKEFKDLIDCNTFYQSNTILLPKYEPNFLVLGYQEDRN